MTESEILERGKNRIERYRLIFEMRTKGMTFTQIGKEFGITPSWAWGLYNRAKSVYAGKGSKVFAEDGTIVTL